MAGLGNFRGDHHTPGAKRRERRRRTLARCYRAIGMIANDPVDFDDEARLIDIQIALREAFDATPSSPKGRRPMQLEAMVKKLNGEDERSAERHRRRAQGSAPLP